MVQRRRGFGRLRRERSGGYSAAYIGPDLRLHRVPDTFNAKIDAEGWLAVERQNDLDQWIPPERRHPVRVAGEAPRAVGAFATSWLDDRRELCVRPRGPIENTPQAISLILSSRPDAPATPPSVCRRVVEDDRSGQKTASSRRPDLPRFALSIEWQQTVMLWSVVRTRPSDCAVAACRWRTRSRPLGVGINLSRPVGWPRAEGWPRRHAQCG
jgi:hypothetical protein